MKVALVFPRFHYWSGDPPLGVGYLAAMLRDQPGVSVDILDTTFQLFPARRLARDFQREQYDIVGISIMSSMVTAGSQVAALAKRARKDTRVIMGGPHPTVMPEQTLADPNVDTVCIGEAERTFPQILNQFPELDEIRGLAFRKDGSIVRNEPVQPIQNLDSLPMPAWELFPMRAYLRNWFQLDSVSRSSPGTSILASRGCPYHCAFCQPTLHKLFGRRLRKRSGQNVAEEVASLVSSHGLKAFMFQDDTFTIDSEWARSVARSIHQKNPGVIWGCNVRTDCARSTSG